MNKDELQKSREVYKALIVLAEFLKTTENDIASKVAFLDDDKFQKIKTAVNLVNDFNSKTLKERTELLGYSYSEKEDGVCEISTVLSE